MKEQDYPENGNGGVQGIGEDNLLNGLINNDINININNDINNGIDGQPGDEEWLENSVSGVKSEELFEALNSQSAGKVTPDREIVDYLNEYVGYIVSRLDSAYSNFYGKTQYTTLLESAKNLQRLITNLDRKLKRGDVLTENDMNDVIMNLQIVGENSDVYREYKYKDLENKGIDINNPGRVPKNRIQAAKYAADTVHGLLYNMNNALMVRQAIARPEQEINARIYKHQTLLNNPNLREEDKRDNLAAIIYYNTVLKNIDKYKTKGRVVNALYQSELEKHTEEIKNTEAFRRMFLETDEAELFGAATDQNGKKLFNKYIKRLTTGANLNEGKKNLERMRNQRNHEMAMLDSFADELEKRISEIMGTYGRGKADKAPSKLMQGVIDAMKAFASKDGSIPATPEERKANMRKLTMHEFNARMDNLNAKIDSYLVKRQNPSKTDRIRRNSALTGLKTSIPSYKDQIKANQTGNVKPTVNYKIGNETKGNQITVTDLKKNLLAFGFYMADMSNINIGALPEVDPKSYQYGPMDYPKPKNPPLLAQEVFDKMREFYNFFDPIMVNGNPIQQPLTFDKLSEQITAINDSCELYFTKHPNPVGNDQDAQDTHSFIEAERDHVREVLRNIKKIEPLMNLKVDGVRIGSMNIVTAANTLGEPYNNLFAIFDESRYVKWRNDDIVNATNRVSADIKKDKNLLQNKITGNSKFRSGIFSSINADAQLYAGPAQPDIKETKMKSRIEGLFKIAAIELFADYTDEADGWEKISSVTNKQSSVASAHIKNNILPKLMEVPEFVETIKASNSRDVKDNLLKKAESIGKTDMLKEMLSPESVMKAIQQPKAEAGKNAFIK